MHPGPPAHGPADHRSEARAVLAELRRRGWVVVLAGGQPVVTAPLRSLSPGLVSRLARLADAITDILEEEHCR
jgi:hypothetical protein